MKSKIKIKRKKNEKNIREEKTEHSYTIATLKNGLSTGKSFAQHFNEFASGHFPYPS